VSTVFDILQDTDPSDPTATIAVLDDPDPDVIASRQIRVYDRDLDLSNDLILDGKKVDANIGSAITGGSISLTTEGASTIQLIVHDPNKTLSKSEVLSVGTIITIDELDFALVHVNRSGPTITLTFEDAEVNELRKHNKPKKAYRDKVTRAEFIHSLVREVKNRIIHFYSPEEHVDQKIKKPGRAQSDQERLDNRGRGVSKNNHHVTVKGYKATKKQIEYANKVLDVGYSMNCSYKVLVSGMEVIITETAIANPDEAHSDGDSAGLFQQTRKSYPNIDRRDPETAARAYFEQAKTVAKTHPGYAAWEIAASIQRPRSDLRTKYNLWRNEAVDWVRAYGASGDEGAASFTRRKRYPFTRGQNGKKEDSWTAIQRLAQEVNWRAFMWRGTLYYMSEEDLYAQYPRMLLIEGEDGVDQIDYDYDTGKTLGECTVTGRFNRWIAPPGSCVVVYGEGEPVDGRWIVHTLDRDLFAKQGTITLKKPSHSFLEPAPDTTQEQLDSKVEGNIERAYARAEEMHKMHRNYVWGGGHGPGFGPTGNDGTGKPGWDCSGAVSDVLHAGGMLKGAPLSTGGLKSWGKHGHGEHMTVWVRETSDPHQSHTFINFHMPKKGTEHFGTGDWGKGWSGAGFNKHLHSTDGFEPRHWPGKDPKFGTPPPLQKIPKGVPVPKLPPLPNVPPNVPPPPLRDDNPLDPNQNLPGSPDFSSF
jgi:hypothetical protein